jgi:putative ABC transport system permease protein
MMLPAKLQALLSRRRLDAEMAEEIRLHLEQRIHENIASGMSPDEARYAALRRFGGVEQVKAMAREQRSFAWLEQFAQDLRYGARQLGRHRGFTVVAVLTLALGLSANITLFSLISFFFFKPLQVKEPERLVVLSQQSAKFEMAVPISWRDFQDYRAGVAEFSDVLALAFRPVHLSIPGRPPERTWIEAVSGNYFSMLGVEPLHGRLFLPGEGEHDGADPIVVLGHDFWQAKLGGDPAVVGEMLTLNGQPFRVVGIAPPTFSSVQWMLLPSAFVPATMMGRLFPGAAAALENREAPMFKVFAQLAPGVDIQAARAAVEVVHRRLLNEYSPAGRERQPRLVLLPEVLSRPDPSVAGVMPFAAAVFMTLVSLVLLIACSNVANLMFARAVDRQREMGVRSALGASRGRLTRQLLTESLLIALIAGAVGFVLSAWSGGFLARFAPGGDIPVKMDERWDWNGVLFTLGASLLAGLVTALVPALRATKVDIQGVLKGAPVQSGRTRHWFRSGLVVSQVGLCVVLLVCGGLFLRSLRQLAMVDLGFRPAGVLLASVDPGLNGYSGGRGLRFVEEATERVQALPSVESVAMATSVPFGNQFQLRKVRPVSQAALMGREGAAADVEAGINRVHGDYLGTLRVRLLRGRAFGREDTASSPAVAIVNETLARRFWPDGRALGERIVMGEDGVAREIVGVVRDGKYLMLAEKPRPFVLVPLAQSYGAPLTVHVRTGSDPAGVVPDLRRVLQEIDADLPIFDVRTMEEHLRTSVFGFMPLRAAATLAGTQGVLGLVLAVMGLYGVVAYSVSQRTREIGIRVALGAAPRDVLRLVMQGGFRLTLVGLAIGIGLALLVAQALARLLYGLHPMDGQVFGAVVVLVIGVSVLACWLPARRAMKVDPMVALRAE